MISRRRFVRYVSIQICKEAANHTQRDKPRSLRVHLTQEESYREVKIRDLYQLKS